MCQRIHGVDEIGLFLGTLEQCPRSHTQGKRAIGLAMGDLGTHQTGSVLRRGDFDATTGIENGDHQRFQLFLDALGERGVEDLAGNIEREFSHGSVPLRGREVELDLARSRLRARTRAT